MYEVFWSKSAKKDLVDIVRYYNENAGSVIANKICEVINYKINSLCFAPNRTRPGRKKGTREFLIQRYPYIVVIKVNNEKRTVIVINIVHTSKKYP